MDREQEEIQFLGFFGILQESVNIVSSWRKIFAQITTALILPLSFIYLAHIQISEFLFSEIMHNEFILDRTPEGSGYYNKISDVLSSELITFFLFKIGYFIFFMILLLLSTSAVVYTIACIYTAKEITFRKVMSVVPKVWKRLMVTFIWNFIIVFAFNIISLLLFILGAITLGQIPILGILFLIFFVLSYLVGLFYITIIWHLASVVSVLEESYGLNAMRKSQNLIKGRMGVAFAVFFLVGLCFFAVQLMVVLGHDWGIGNRIGFGIVSLILLSIATIFGLITQTIIYFVCKSYHHENIDKSSLSDHLGGYLGEYVPLKARDVQLEHFEV
ncbi:hypothetical protein ACS0TY_030401 [Phlomoides rotata]